ncbi:SRPBCC family protein [Streptomyces sp. NBC_01455]|uniref:SRPBCC family protein n=1 Tax=Streptomyces sp. NBC_01455 TaxID=2903874 RepID=UPI002E37E20B|nr:SRPBCC family protein [Streptomyces sp. NBC_01455]
MASTSVSRVVPASPGRVWEVIGGFGSLPDWVPQIAESTPLEGGRVRRLVMGNGEVVVERLTGFSEGGRHYTYTIVEAPFPVAGYLATIRVHTVPGEPDSAEVEWSGRFHPLGSSDDEMVALFTGIYRGGLDALHTELAD